MVRHETRLVPLLGVALLLITLLTAPQPLVQVLIRTLILCAPTCALAVALTLPVALHVHLPSRLPAMYTVALGLAALLLPTPVIGVLTSDVLGVEPYTTTHLLLIHVLAGLPPAFLAQTALLRGLDPHAISQAHALGLGTTRILLRAHPRELLVAVLVAWQATILVTATDPGLTLPFGGRESYLASATLHAATTSIEVPAEGHLVLVIAAGCLLVAAQVPRTVLAPARPATRYLYASSRILPGITGILALALGATVVALLWRAAEFRDLSDAPTALVGSLLAALPVVTLAFPVALVTAFVFRHRERTTALPVMVLLAALTMAGPVVAAVFRAPIQLGGVSLLPSLVGGGGLSGGYWALALVYGLIALPVLYLVARSTVRASRPQIDAARDAGASGVRTFLAVVWPQTRGAWIASTLGVLALLLTRTAPAVYLDAPGIPQVGAQLTTAAAGANGATVYVLGAAVYLTGVALLLVLLAVVTTSRKEFSRV